MNQSQLWCCEICDKTIKIESKSKHKTSKSHEHKNAYGTVDKQYEFTNPVIDEVNYILNDTIKDCGKNTFNHVNIDVLMILNL